MASAALFCLSVCVCAVHASMVLGDMIELVQFNTMKSVQLQFYRQCYLCGFVNFNLFYVIKFKLNLLFDWSFCFSFQLYMPERKEELGTAHTE